MKRMTKQRALQVLLSAAQAHARGAGQGLAQRPNEEEQTQIRLAAETLWRDAYDFDIPSMWPQW